VGPRAFGRGLTDRGLLLFRRRARLACMGARPRRGPVSPVRLYRPAPGGFVGSDIGRWRGWGDGLRAHLVRAPRRGVRQAHRSVAADGRVCCWPVVDGVETLPLRVHSFKKRAPLRNAPLGSSESLRGPRPGLLQLQQATTRPLLAPAGRSGDPDTRSSSPFNPSCL